MYIILLRCIAISRFLYCIFNILYIIIFSYNVILPEAYDMCDI